MKVNNGEFDFLTIIRGPFPYHAIAWTIICPGLRELNRESWPAVQFQMVDAMVRMERAVVPYLQRWLEEEW